MKQETVNRDPTTSVRDPVLSIRSEERRICEQRKKRRFIAASMPTVCPECGGNTRMADGRHVDPVRQTILEYRTCANCNAPLAAGRPMTDYEKAHLCVRSDAVKEYEDSLKKND